MADKNNKKATPLSGDKREPPHIKDYNQKWDSIKLDVFEIYIRQNESLEATRAAILGSHGFESCPRTWKGKLKEWGYNKNMTTPDMQWIVAKGKKRALEGKYTTFFHGVTHVTAQRIENFKRRKMREVSASAPTPPNITYNTPNSLSSEGDTLEEMYDEFTPYHSPLSQMSNSSVAQAGLAGPLGSEIRCPLTTKFDLTEVPPISILDQWLSNELQPWSVYHLCHQLGDHDIVLAKHRRILAQVTELVAVSQEQNSLFVDLSNEHNCWPELCCIEDQFFVDSCSATDDEQGGETSEVLELESLFSRAVTLAEFQNTHGEFATPTLRQEFELAKAVEQNGNHEEAEYHCRRILDRDPQVIVQSFLGMILANTSRLGESTFLLFSALANFIIEFTFSSVEEDALRFPPIEFLFTELILKSEQDWGPLTLCLCQMMATIRKAISNSTTSQIFPQLLIHGFSFAHECSVLEFIDSAKYMYRVLLEHSSHLDVILYGIERATAHREYGLLLRREGRLASSAEQLLLACESAMDSGAHDSRLIALLKSDYIVLLPCLAFEPKDEDPLVERIRKLLIRNQRQDSPHRQDTSKAVRLSRVEEYLLSDLPKQFVTLKPSAFSYVAQFGLSSTATDSVHGGGDRTSTVSASASASTGHRYGKTYSISEVTGISDSIFMTP